LGELREHEGVLGETVKHVKRGGDSALLGRRGGGTGSDDHMEEVVDRNMKEAVDFATHFFEENHVRRVLIGGSDENIAMFRGLLPKAWQSLVMATFNMAMTAGNQEVRARALHIGVEVALKIEAELVDVLVTEAASLNCAVIGMVDTYDAINHGRVKTLVFIENLKKEGFVCNHCAALYPTKVDEICPLCAEGKLERTLDGVELAVSAVMRHGGEVSVVRPHPVLQNYEGIGAILRY
ncbi:MAG: hypothetical protein Q7U74_09275, partial [Saprospiraceae bacterium]|nr:hypothetical protein [Saprospiraceae bacterium]